MTIIWKTAGEQDSPYEVNNIGEVKRNGKILKTCHCRNNYLYVSFCIKHVTKRQSVHRLVAKAFIPNPENKRTVNHKDGNRQNNCLDNLEWATHSENHFHAFRELGKKPTTPWLGKFGADHNRSKSFTIIRDGVEETYESGLDFKRRTGLDNTSISWAAIRKELPHTFSHGTMKGIILIKHAELK